MVADASGRVAVFASQDSVLMYATSATGYLVSVSPKTRPAHISCRTCSTNAALSRANSMEKCKAMFSHKNYSSSIGYVQTFSISLGGVDTVRLKRLKANSKLLPDGHMTAAPLIFSAVLPNQEWHVGLGQQLEVRRKHLFHCVRREHCVAVFSGVPAQPFVLGSVLLCDERGELVGVSGKDGNDGEMEGVAEKNCFF